MVQHPYFRSIVLIERLHRQFLELLKAELDRQGIRDINNVQALILYNISADELTVGELTARGYYLGSNVSYNVKKMVEHGYLMQERSTHDRRSVRVRLSEKGLELRNRLRAMFDLHVQAMPSDDITEPALEQLNSVLMRLEHFWLTRASHPLASVSSAA